MFVYFLSQISKSNNWKIMTKHNCEWSVFPLRSCYSICILLCICVLVEYMEAVHSSIHFIVNAFCGLERANYPGCILLQTLPNINYNLQNACCCCSVCHFVVIGTMKMKSESLSDASVSWIFCLVTSNKLGSHVIFVFVPIICFCSYFHMLVFLWSSYWSVSWQVAPVLCLVLNYVVCIFFSCQSLIF